ncbi:hypothetical protein LEP1GSC005_3312 [Leptospira santarosai str. ST188]|nr:hypothetical protein LEP1GSC179_3327 [Leptospira santarosai str. MOR084]EKS09934.1 hypothetical protein LEP1GSC071_2360 [Leptospira santarosai str. JET]EMF92670.1 hypothetical protein LEP1GSC005_3312 [Leptospira santarosai str. ST188]EMM75335.1 hypothetical protein LEP1GSC040_3190 [Leptospira santarosai str. 2000030832]EMM86401.1 hypothetical protein LEP1GSC039_2018 [Leptospira santarosai str. 2000027870]EMN19534.1 hypothetical protein LEP1GSC063_1595 [Leptospira santarosai serovar Arenal s
MTPTRAVETFILCRKKSEPISEEVILVLDSFESWNEIELTGLLNASFYFPDILNGYRSEQTIQLLLEKFQRKIVEIPIQ